MEYQCECGEVFDVYEQNAIGLNTYHDDYDLSILVQEYGVRCPKCGRVYICTERHQWDSITQVTPA